MCLTTVILAPGASEVGLGAAALASLWVDTPLKALNSARSLFMRRLRTWEPFARNWTSEFVKKLRGSRAAQRDSKRAKVGPRTQKGSQSALKGSQQITKLYTHKTKYTQTPDPPPSSGRLVICIGAPQAPLTAEQSCRSRFLLLKNNALFLKTTVCVKKQ